MEAPKMETPANPPSETPENPPSEAPNKDESFLRESVMFLRDICIILVVVLLVRAYLVAPFRISGSSMESNYFNGEFILVNKLAFDGLGMHIGNHQRGDVVVIEPHADNGRQFYIKRIIGLPGEKLKLEDGKVFIQKAGTFAFVQLNETYLDEKNFGKTFPGKTGGQTLFEIPEGEYFIMGDNRNASADARDCFYSCTVPGSTHYIYGKDIVGKVWITLGALHVFDEFSIGQRQYDGSIA
jgi:signal peptidase I